MKHTFNWILALVAALALGCSAEPDLFESVEGDAGQLEQAWTISEQAYGFATAANRICPTSGGPALCYYPTAKPQIVLVDPVAFTATQVTQVNNALNGPGGGAGSPLVTAFNARMSGTGYTWASTSGGIFNVALAPTSSVFDTATFPATSMARYVRVDCDIPAAQPAIMFGGTARRQCSRTSVRVNFTALAAAFPGVSFASVLRQALGYGLVVAAGIGGQNADPLAYNWQGATQTINLGLSATGNAGILNTYKCRAQHYTTLPVGILSIDPFVCL